MPDRMRLLRTVAAALLRILDPRPLPEVPRVARDGEPARRLIVEPVNGTGGTVIAGVERCRWTT